MRIEYGEFGKRFCNGACNAALDFVMSVFLLSVQVRRVLMHINIDLVCIFTVLSKNWFMKSMYQ